MKTCLLLAFVGVCVAVSQPDQPSGSFLPQEDFPADQPDVNFNQDSDPSGSNAVGDFQLDLELSKEYVDESVSEEPVDAADQPAEEVSDSEVFGSVPEDDPQADVDEPVPVYEVPACKPEFVDDIRSLSETLCEVEEVEVCKDELVEDCREVCSSESSEEETEIATPNLVSPPETPDLEGPNLESPPETPDFEGPNLESGEDCNDVPAEPECLEVDTEVCEELDVPVSTFVPEEVCEEMAKPDCVKKTVEKCEEVHEQKCRKGLVASEVQVTRNVCTNVTVPKCETIMSSVCNDVSSSSSGVAYTLDCKPVRKLICDEDWKPSCVDVPKKVCKEVSAQEMTWVTYQECSGSPSPRYKRSLFGKLLYKLGKKASSHHYSPSVWPSPVHASYKPIPVHYSSTPKCWPVQKWVPKEVWKNVCEDVWTQDCDQGPILVPGRNCREEITEDCQKIPFQGRRMMPKEECKEEPKEVCISEVVEKCEPAEDVVGEEVPLPLCEQIATEKCKPVEEEVCEEATEMGCRIVEREVIVNEKQQVCKVKRVPQCRPIERVNCKLPVPAEIPPKTCTQVCLPRTERKCETKPESVCRDEERTISVQIPLNNCEVVTPASVLAEDSVTPVLNDEPEIGERAEDDELEYPDY